MKNILDYAAIGKRIREERKRQGITIDILAQRAGISYVHMCHIEVNRTKVSLPALVSIANALGVTMDFILCDNLEKKEGAYLTAFEELTRDATPKQIELILEIAKTVLRNSPQNTG